MRACRKYWLMAVSSIFRALFRNSMTLASPRMLDLFPPTRCPRVGRGAQRSNPHFKEKRSKNKQLKMLLRVFLGCSGQLVGGGERGHHRVLVAHFLDEVRNGGQAASALGLAAHGPVRGGGRADVRRARQNIANGSGILGIAHANDHLRSVSCPAFLPVSRHFRRERQNMP